jgi:FkbM family methyltransferase
MDPGLVEHALELGRQALPGYDIDVFWKGFWVFRVGSYFFPDPDPAGIKQPAWQYLGSKAVENSWGVQEFWYHVYRPRAGDVIVDIGAGCGEDVFGFSRSVGPSGRVWAIEAHPVSFSVLELFCSHNGLSNVSALNVACVEKSEQLQIESLPNWQTNYVRPGEPSINSHPVAGVTLDSICEDRNIGRIDFLKMNIEGCERLALPGCRLALQRTRNVCIATHDFRADRGEGEQFRTAAYVRKFLRDAGFELTTRDEDPRYYVREHVHGQRAACPRSPDVNDPYP